MAYKNGWLGPSTFLLRTRTGLTFEIPWSLKFVFKDIFLHEAYTRPFILKHLPVAPVVVDIGANIGFFSLYALHRRPAARVFSFEPLQANWQRLQSNRARNPQAAWQILQWAVSGKNGVVQLFSATGGGMSTYPTIRPECGQSESGSVYSESVQTRTLEEVFSSQSIGHCDWLKIDCEGAEYEILYGTTPEVLRRISFISVEADRLDDRQCNGPALGNFLEARDFDVYYADDSVIYAVNRQNGGPADRPASPLKSARLDLPGPEVIRCGCAAPQLL
jgi:FkbM family methyltransferase